MKPRLLDLFCGAGGCTKGYQRAGFYVVGVDIKPQPNYCGDEFHCGDAFDVLRRMLMAEALGQPPSRWGFALDEFDAIHASPPCQAHVKGLGAVNHVLGRTSKHRDLIPAVRQLLMATGLPYVIENVEGAPLRNAVKLCGSSFRLPLRRHRLFETNFPLMVPPCNHSWQIEKRYWTSVSAHRGEDRHTSTVVQVYGNGGGSEHWADALDIDWMDKRELTQAIPPAYCEHIGHYLMAEIKARQAA